MAAFAPDYESYFENEKLCDVIITLEDEPDRRGKRRRNGNKVIIPGHSMVLLAFSDYCKTKLDNWSTNASSSSSSQAAKLQIHMPVPAGQIELARLLIKGMYQKEPNITADLNHEQLLQLMLLADRFGVPKVLAAVMQAFSAVPAEQLQWQTALDLLQLPPACVEQPRFKPVHQLAVGRLLQQLGDLEKAWFDEQLQELLLNLPFAALHQLLQHPTLRVASENTVVYTIQRWFEQQYGAPHNNMSSEQVAQAKQLMQLVRMQHCTSLYVGTIMMHSRLAQQCFSAVELSLARECCMPGGLQLLTEARLPVLEKFPAWSATKRPASLQPQVIEWDIPLRNLQEAIDQLLQSDSTNRARFSSTPHILQGQEMTIEAVIRTSDASTQGQPNSDNNSRAYSMQILLGTKLHNLPDGAVRRVSAKFAITAAPSGALTQAAAGSARPNNDIVKGPVSLPGISAQAYAVWNVLDLGKVYSWDQVQLLLIRKQLVHTAEPQAENDQPYLRVQMEINELQ